MFTSRFSASKPDWLGRAIECLENEAVLDQAAARLETVISNLQQVAPRS